MQFQYIKISFGLGALPMNIWWYSSAFNHTFYEKIAMMKRMVKQPMKPFYCSLMVGIRRAGSTPQQPSREKSGSALLTRPRAAAPTSPRPGRQPAALRLPPEAAGPPPPYASTSAQSGFSLPVRPPPQGARLRGRRGSSGHGAQRSPRCQASLTPLLTRWQRSR